MRVSRLITGLWQVADMERSGTIDVDAASTALLQHYQSGLTTFDMADHYGSAETLIADFLRKASATKEGGTGPGTAGTNGAQIFTKWSVFPRARTV